MGRGMERSSGVLSYYLMLPAITTNWLVKGVKVVGMGTEHARSLLDLYK